MSNDSKHIDVPAHDSGKQHASKEAGVSLGVHELISQAKQMQAELEAAHLEAQDFTAKGSAAGGLVEAIARGDNRILSIHIDPHRVDIHDTEMLEHMVIAACNNALREVQTQVRTTLARITDDMSIPGLF